MDNNESSVSDLFKSAKASQEELDLLDPRSPEFKTLLTSAISNLEQCSQLVDRLALFSTNEDLEDISTTNIQYLGIDYLLAEANMRAYDSNTRLAQLNKSSQLLDKFLSQMNDYSLLSTTDKKLLESYKDSPRNFRIVREDAGLEAKRNTKIKRFQDEKALKTRLTHLREQQSSSSHLNLDDEVIRNLYLAELSLYVHNTFQSLDVMSQERQILSNIPPTAPADHTPQQSSNGDTRSRTNGTATTNTSSTYSDRLDPSSLLASNNRSAILDSSGRPLQPFTITSQRTNLQKGVFRPGHSLPTMSIEEYLEEEHKRGGIIDGGGPQSEVVTQPDEDDLREVDAATMKAREWDEYVEANPKGAGNTLNRG